MHDPKYLVDEGIMVLEIIVSTVLVPYNLKPYLEGRGDLVSRLVTHIVTLVIPIINPVTTSPPLNPEP